MVIRAYPYCHQLSAYCFNCQPLLWQPSQFGCQLQDGAPWRPQWQDGPHCNRCPLYIPLGARILSFFSLLPVPHLSTITKSPIRQPQNSASANTTNQQKQPPSKMAPPRHLKLTLPRKPPSSYTGSSASSSSSSSSPSALECDIPVPSVEHVDSADHTEHWVVHSSGSRANSVADIPATPPGLWGTPNPSEISAPTRTPSASRGHSLSDDETPRSLPSASPILAASPSGGEQEIKRAASEDDIWSASPRLPTRRSSVPVPGDDPAPSQSPSVSGPRVLGSTSSGRKRTRDVEDDGAGDRSSQRRRSVSPGHPSRRSSVSVSGDAPAPSPSPSVSGPRALGSTSSGSKRTRDAEDDGAGRSSQRRRTANSEPPPRQSSASIPSKPATSSSSSSSGPSSSHSASSSGERSRPLEGPLRPGLPYNSIMEGMMEVALAGFRPPEPAAAPSVPEPVVDPSDPAVDAAVTTDRAGAVDPVAAPAQPVALAVVAAVSIVDIAPAVGPAIAVAAAVANPVPLPDRAEARLRARIDAVFARCRGQPRAERFDMVSSSPPPPPTPSRNLSSLLLTLTQQRSLDAWLSREEKLQDLQDRARA